MNGMEFNFDEGESKPNSRFLGGNRRRNKKSKSYQAQTSSTGTGGSGGVGGGRLSSSSAYHLHSNPSMDNTEDGSVSLTYSVSSSQAGESTDSSIADLGALLQVGEGEQQYHMLQQKQAQRMRNGSGHYGNHGRNLSREKSNCDSLGYSDDDDGDSVNYANWMTISGQPSDSFAHDGGSSYKSSSHGHGRGSVHVPAPEPSPRIIHHKHKKLSSAAFSSPQSISADLNSCAGSNGTPNTPPPRPSSKKSLSHDTEVWYQKWWMCGFTDALNLNPKCLD